MSPALAGGGIAVVIPARNEAPSIGDVVRATRACGHPVIVADDRSSDDTAARAEAAGALVLELPCRLGAWGAAQAGMRLALRRGCGIVVTLDGDGQHRPVDIRALADPVAAGATDIAIGSCPERGGAARQAAWRLFKSLSGLNVADLTSGFRAYSRPAALAMLGADATLADYQDIGVLLLARRRRFRVVEVPVRMDRRAHGGSQIFSSWLKVARYMAYTATMAVAQRRAETP